MKSGVYYVAGIDSGSTSTDVVILDQNGKIKSTMIIPTGGGAMMSAEKSLAAAVEKAGAALKEAGAKRVVPLKVSGPFHSAMLTGAGEKLAEVLENTKLQEFSIPYVTNVTADYVTTTEPVKELLKKQVSSSVRWQQSIERLIADGYDEFVEIGPGHTLSGFMRKINRDVKTVSIEKLEDYKAYVGE